MTNNRRYPFARAAMHGLAILGLVFAAGASATPAHAAPPLNDSIDTAIKITTSVFTAAITDINNATLDAGDPFLSCESFFGTGDATVWYTFTPAKSGVLSLNTNASGYDTVVAVFIGDSLIPPTITEIGCNNDVDAWVKTSSLTVNLRGGIKYYIEVARDSMSPAPTPPDALRLNFTFTPKIIAWGTPGGKIWDSNDGVFTFSAGWQLLPFLGTYKNNYRVSNTVNGTAVTYFDGIGFDLGYVMGPGMGWLEVRVDDIVQGTIGQNAGTYSIPPLVSFGPYADGVHKLTLRHTAGSTKANFDYITVYSFPDFIPPDQITDLNAATGTTTGKVTLYWTSVGDDGLVGTATSYEVQYMLDDGINSCWDWGNPFIATPINWGLPVPKIAGTPQQATLSGLAPGVDYLFCIAAIDDGGNYGLPSNDAWATAYAGVPFGTGTYDDRHSGWTYVGNWRAISYRGARYNTLHISNKVGNFAFFYFTGKQLVLTYSASPTGGLLDVYIDGMYETTLDTYSPGFSVNRLYTSRILHLGPHSVKLVHNTLGPPETQVIIDQIYINSPDDEGAPDPIIDLAAVPGFNDGEVDLTWTATGDDPGGVGTAVKYEVRYSHNPILTENDWHYATPAGGLIPAPQPASTPEGMTVVGLTPGVYYYFAILAYDNAWYRVLSNSSSADAAYSGAWQGPGFYDDADPSWTYNGTWLQQFPLNATNVTQHRSGLYATSAVFHFTGTGFILTFQKNYNLGGLWVYVDGVKVGRIYQSTLPYGYQMIWDSLAYLGPLLPGNHVVEFRLIGRATIDEIQILP